MTIHVNIGEAKTRLSELLRAMRSGERVIIQRDGKPEAELVLPRETEAIERAARAAKRAAAIRMLAKKYAHLPESAFDIPEPLDEDYWKERIARKGYS